MHYEESRMCQPKSAVTFADTGQKLVANSTLPHEVREVLDAAERLYAAIGEHAPGIVLPHDVEQEWKRLGECLAWLRR